MDVSKCFDTMKHATVIKQLSNAGAPPGIIKGPGLHQPRRYRKRHALFSVTWLLPLFNDRYFSTLTLLPSSVFILLPAYVFISLHYHLPYLLLLLTFLRVPPSDLQVSPRYLRGQTRRFRVAPRNLGVATSVLRVATRALLVYTSDFFTLFTPLIHVIELCHILQVFILIYVLPSCHLILST